MPMNINGDFVTRFGDRLPVPYMENITVRDNTFEIQLSFYIKPPNFEQIDTDFYNDYLDSLQNLTVSIVTVADGVKSDGSDPSGISLETDPEQFYKKYGPIKIGADGTRLFEQLMSNDINILQIATPDNKSYSSRSDESFTLEQVKSYENITDFINPNCSTILYNEKLNVTDFIKEDLYNSQGELVHKYTQNIIISDTGAAGDTTSDSTSTNTLSQYINSMLEGLNTHFVAFTTSVAEYPNDFTEEQKSSILNSDAKAQILFKQVSDLSYEQISANKAIKSSEINIFKTTSGEHFDGNVLQSIDYAYYGNSQLTNQDIINTFTDLIGTTTDTDLQSKFDNLAFMLLVHGKKTDILTRLNDFRKTFVETSTATPVGRMHEKLELRLYNSNNAVKRGVPLVKTLNVSPTVVDGRSIVRLPYTPPEEEDRYKVDKANHYIYTKTAKLGAYALPAGYVFSTEEAQAVVDSLNTTYEELKEAERDAQSLAQQAFENIVSTIGDAFSDFSDDNDVYISDVYIPEFMYYDYKVRKSDLLELSLYAGGEAKAPVTLNNGEQGDNLKLYVQRSALAGDLDEDGTVTSSPVWQTVVVKVWPVPISYADIFADYGIKKLENGEYVQVNSVDIRDLAWYKTARSTSIVGELYEGAYRYPPKDFGYQFASPWYEFYQFISEAQYTSGTEIDVQSKDETEHITAKFDKRKNIIEAVDEFKFTYETYLQAALEVDQVRGALSVYTQVAALGGLAGVDLIYTQYNLYLNGFVFFDYEKALKESSNISKLLDVSKVETLLGKQLSHTYFKVMDSKIEKFFDKSLDEGSEPEDLTSGGGGSGLVFFRDLSGIDPTDADVTQPTEAYIESVAGGSRYPTIPIKMGDVTSYTSTSENYEDKPGVDPYTEQYRQMAIALPNRQRQSNPVHFTEREDNQGTFLGSYVNQPTWNNMTFGELDNDQRVYSFFIPRSFQLAAPDANHDYRLLCYEFQDVVGPYSVGATHESYNQNVADGFENNGGDFGADYLFEQNQFGNSYIVTINVEDNTKDMYSMIVKNFLQAKNEYENYYQAIIEECSHNLSDERMNEFFIDGVLSSYSSAPHLAPWYRASLVYYIHLDLISDTYGGSMDLINQAAIQSSQSLHPANITLTQAESFRNLLQNLWESYYEPDSGQIALIADTLSTKLKVTFGGMNSTDGYVAIMNDLPRPVNLDYLGASYATGDVVAIDTDDL